MNHSVLRLSAIAIGVACLVSLSPLSPARASAPGQGASAPGGAASATPATSPSSGPAVVQRRPHAYVRHQHYVRHHARYARDYRHHPIAAGATTVAGGIADLGSIAAYPIYCFPNYGSCPVYLPY